MSMEKRFPRALNHKTFLVFPRALRLERLVLVSKEPFESMCLGPGEPVRLERPAESIEFI